MDIGRQILEKTAERVGIVLKNYERKINQAYLEADDELAVGLKATFKPAGSGVKVKVEMNFIAERVKDKSEFYVDEVDLGPLFNRPAPAARPEPDRDGSGNRSRGRWYVHR